MTTIDVQTAASGDDGHFRPAGTNYSSAGTTLIIGRHSGGEAYQGFARFTGITIPAGSTIDTAYISLLQTSVAGVDTIYLKIAAEDADNPSAPTTAPDGAGRALTTARVDWDPASWSANTWYDSPDISAVIQELVDSYTISGDAIQIFILDDGSANDDNRSVRTYDHAAGNGPKLHIEYTEGSSDTELVVADAAHGHATDGIALTQAHTLVVADADHAHASDGVALTQAQELAVADALHAHAADNVVLELSGTLEVADATHAHTTDAIALSQAHILAVAQADHAHIADGLVLTLSLIHI